MKLPLLTSLARLFFALPLACQAGAVEGNSTISAPAGPSEIVIKTTTRLAGAIDSLTWNGKEFIDSFDHGRQLQSAVNLDAGSPILAETFNPTEAGSRNDGRGDTSSSELLELQAAGDELTTTSKMAFWLAPGQKSGPNPAKNTTVLSNHQLTKRVKIGYKDLPNVIAYDVTFTIPPDEQHTHVVFEALTGYMPPEFEEFLQFNPVTEDMEPLDDGPGEIPFPVVLTIPGGSHAMGIYAPPQSAPNTVGPTFGRFRFTAEKVVKWNCVFRVTDSNRLSSGPYSFRMFVIVGDLATVTDAMRALHHEFGTSS